MKRTINKFDEWTNSWFAVEVEENETVNKIYQWIADKLPKRLIFFCYVRFMAFATTHGEGVKMTPDEMGFSKAVEIWESYQD